MMILPYRVDGPVDHRPWGTAALILANLLIAFLMGFPGHGGAVDSLTLKFGTVNPLTWVSSCFAHFGWMHLIFNMAFLWWFGVIAEGLAGWRKFVPLYLAIGVAVSALVQILMLGAQGQAAGASGAIFGTMAVAALWAPETKVETYVVVPLFRAGVFRPVTFTVRGLAYIYLFFEIFQLLILSFSMSSALIHVFGAAAGIALGTWMLRKGLVDTGGWDWFSLRKGRPLVLVAEEPSGALPQEAAPDILTSIRAALDSGDAIAADSRYESARRADHGFVLPREDFLRLAEGLGRSNAPEVAMRRMEEYLAAYPEGPVRLTLARLLLENNRPRGALDQLTLVDPQSDAQREAKAHLEDQARGALGAASLELE